MTPKQRLLAALDGRKPDRLPVTTHHVMPYFLNKYLGGMDQRRFLEEFGFDADLHLLRAFTSEASRRRYDD